jgi:hypothetical protein
VLFTSYLRPQCCSRKGVAMEVGQPRIRVATAQRGMGLVAPLVTFNVPMGTAVGSDLFIKS